MDEQGEERLQAMEAWEAMVCRGMGRASYSPADTSLQQSKVKDLETKRPFWVIGLSSGSCFYKKKGKGGVVGVDSQKAHGNRGRNSCAPRPGGQQVPATSG